MGGHGLLFANWPGGRTTAVTVTPRPAVRVRLGSEVARPGRPPARLGGALLVAVSGAQVCQPACSLGLAHQHRSTQEPPASQSARASGPEGKLYNAGQQRFSILALKLETQTQKHNRRANIAGNAFSRLWCGLKLLFCSKSSQLGILRFICVNLILLHGVNRSGTCKFVVINCNLAQHYGRRS